MMQYLRDILSFEQGIASVYIKIMGAFLVTLNIRNIIKLRRLYG